MICTNANVRANLPEIRPTLKTPCLHLRCDADSAGFPWSLRKAAANPILCDCTCIHFRSQWRKELISGKSGLWNLSWMLFLEKITMILWTLDSRVLWDVRRGFGARPSSFRKPYLAFSSHIKFSWGWWWWSIDLYSNTCNCTRLRRGFSDMVCINKGDSVPFLTLVKTLRSICFYVFFFVSVFVSVCVSVFVSLFISW